MSNNSKTAIAALALILAVTAVAAPALAKDRATRSDFNTRGFDARAQAIAPELATKAGNRMSAIHECNEQAASLREYTWGNEQTARYRACMAEHGQPE